MMIPPSTLAAEDVPRDLFWGAVQGLKVGITILVMKPLRLYE